MLSGLIVVSVIVGIVGFFFLSEATMGIGIIGLAALLGIYARLAQAEQYKDYQDRRAEERTVWLRNELLSARKGAKKTAVHKAPPPHKDPMRQMLREEAEKKKNQSS